jgi:hypothetical protein
VRGSRFQTRDRFSNVQDFTHGEHSKLATSNRMNLYELVRIAKWKRANQQSVIEAKDRSVRRDRETQGEEYGESEDGLPNNLTQCET